MASDDKHYVNNKEFYFEMKQYIEKKRNNPETRVPNSIGSKIIKICTRLAFRPNFINYTYKEEMIGDAIENCIAYIDNFNPDKSNNPFSYFTQIAYFAYLRRIEKEKKGTKIKAKFVQNLPDMHELFDHVLMDSQGHDDMQDVYNQMTETIQKYYQHDLSEPKKEEKEKKPRKKKEIDSPLDDFLDD